MEKGIADKHQLPHQDFDIAWNSIKIEKSVRDRLIAQASLALTVRPVVPFEAAPLHGLILLAGPPGTGKTTLARGLAGQIAKLVGKASFLQVDPHALASAAHGKSQQHVTNLFQRTIPEISLKGFGVVLLDEVETLAADRRKMSLEANPVDVHRSTDAVLAGMDLLTRNHPKILTIATTNFVEAVDPAFISRADLTEIIGPPGPEARTEIISDTLNALSVRWPAIKTLQKDLGAFVRASQGLDGRKLRKAIVGAAANSISTAQDPGRLTSSDVLASLKAALNTGNGREAA